MDVNRVNDYGYQAPPPMPGSGEYIPVQVSEAKPVEPASPAPAISEIRAERAAERKEGDGLQRAVSEINSSIAIYRRHLGVRYHEPTNRRIVTVYDSDTNEAVREIPPEKVLEAHANMLEMVGLFVDKRG